MNDIFGDVRKRGRTLLLVEGNHEKEKLFFSLHKAFKELPIVMEDVWIYRTNIYVLIEHIKDEYGSDWSDIDLPFIISKRIEKSEALSYKDDFTDIYLIFDYERQDPNFSVIDIEKMQEVFSDSTDMGKLYINYPMVESYMDYNSIPDDDFENRLIKASLKKGSEYKNTVYNSPVGKMVRLPQKIRKIVSDFKNDSISDYEIETIVDRILTESLDMLFSDGTLEHYISDFVLESNSRYVANLIGAKMKESYINNDISYYAQLNNMYKYIIKSVIRKAHKIVGQTGHKSDIQGIDSLNILKKQNEVSADNEKGFIWVLNTSVMLVYDYNSNLIDNE